MTRPPIPPKESDPYKVVREPFTLTAAVTLILMCVVILAIIVRLT